MMRKIQEIVIAVRYRQCVGGYDSEKYDEEQAATHDKEEVPEDQFPLEVFLYENISSLVGFFHG